MKIFYMYDSLARVGGLEKIFTEKMNYLAEHTIHEIYFISAIQGNHPFVYPLSPKVKHIDLDVRFHNKIRYKYPYRLWIKYKLTQLFFKRLQEIVNQISPNIIITTTNWHSNNIHKLKTKASIIVESHSAQEYTWNSNKDHNGFIKEIIYRYRTKRYANLTQRNCDTLVAITQKDADSWKKVSRVCVIPNMISPPPTVTSNCMSPYVIAAGRFTLQKGFDLLVEAWRIVNERHPKWNLSIYGEGPLQKLLEEKISEYGLKEVVILHPFTSNIYQKYSDSSIFVLSSRFEGFGLVLAEAMSVGLPCISFDCPCGPSDIIKHEEDGLLVKNGDTKELANNICRLIENEEERKEFGKEAKVNVARFYPENIMPQWELLFKQITEKQA